MLSLFSLIFLGCFPIIPTPRTTEDEVNTVKGNEVMENDPLRGSVLPLFGHKVRKITSQSNPQFPWIPLSDPVIFPDYITYL